VGLLREKYDLQQTEQRISFTQEAAALLASLDNAIEADAYIRETAEASGIAPEAIRAEVNRLVGVSPQTPAALRTGMRRIAGVAKAEKGLVEARKGLLSVLLAQPALARQFQAEGHLAPEDMGPGVGPRLLEMAYANPNGAAIEPASAIARFPELADQQQAAALLKDAPHFESPAFLEKAVNEMWQTIKRAQFENMFENLSQMDENAINTLFEAKKTLAKQYITIRNGNNKTVREDEKP